MSRREERERQMAGWLEHLQNCKASGKSMLAYARAHGIGPWAMYRWRKVLRREGRWPEDQDGVPGTQGATAAPDSTRAPLRFARVKVREGSPGGLRLTVRVLLTNGRRAEIDLDDTRHLIEVLGTLERSA